MAESVTEAAPETRPGGPRRGLDRLRAADGGGQPALRTSVRDAAPAAAAPDDAPPTDSVTAPDVVAPVREAPVEPVPAATQDSPATETEIAAPPATAAPGAADTPARGRHIRGLAAALAVLLLLVGWLGYRLWHTHSSAQADKRHYEQVTAMDGRNQAALSAARQAAVTLLTYDYRHLDKDFAAVLSGSTGGFKKDFAGKQATAKTLFGQGKAIAAGQVLDAAVSSSTPTSATVLVVIDQTVKNVSVPNGTVKHYRMQLKMTKVGSAWLVSDVEFPA